MLDDRLADGQRDYDVDLARTNIFGELLVLQDGDVLDDHADLLGLVAVLMLGTGLFTAAALAGCMPNSQTFMIIERAIQGIGGSIVSAVSL